MGVTFRGPRRLVVVTVSVCERRRGLLELVRVVSKPRDVMLCDEAVSIVFEQRTHFLWIYCFYWTCDRTEVDGICINLRSSCLEKVLS